MDTEEGKLESLLKWGADHGILDSIDKDGQRSCLGRSLRVSFFPNAGGRGLGAVRYLNKGERVLIVPKSALMTTQSLTLKDEKLSMALKSYPSLASTQKLTFCLLYEAGKGCSSLWFPYFKHLPRTYDILAAFGEFDKQALQVDYAIWATEKAIKKSCTEWKGANGLMKESNIKKPLRTFKAWLWASATISSRALHVPWDEAGCLCPVGDLFNYVAPGEELLAIGDGPSFSDCASNQNMASDKLDEEQLQLDTQLQRLTDGGYDKDISAYCFYARDNYEKGEQVLLSYGTYTNLELLEYYGFLLYENPNDKLFIPLDHDIYSASSWSKDSLYINQNGNPSFALLPALRLWATPPNKRRAVGHLAYSGSRLSVENEIFVLRWLSKKCNSILTNLPTSIEDDRKLLSNIAKIPDELVKVVASSSSSYGDEMSAFIEANNLVNGEDEEAELHLSDKVKRCLGRWKLAVEWRLLYKEALVNCIYYCTSTITSLSS